LPSFFSKEDIETVKIFIDIDNVTARTNEYFFENCRTRFGRRGMIYDPSNSSAYHLTEWFVKNSYATELEAIAMKEIIFNDVNYWETIPLMYGAKQTIRELNDEAEVVLASDMLTIRSEAPMIGRRRWFQRNFPFLSLNQLYYTSNKNDLAGDYLIEDVAEQAEEFGGKRIIFDYPYNRDFEDCIRVCPPDSWQKVLGIIRGDFLVQGL
jgi:5'(3')-deoxyribonucleotidase